LVADPYNAKSIHDTDTHLLSVIDDTLTTLSIFKKKKYEEEKIIIIIISQWQQCL
jgi:hypothetical protein